MLLVYGLIPLLVFVIVDIYAGMRWAVGSAIAFAVLDIFLTKASLGVWDPGSFVALGLIAALGGYSLKTENPLYFKLQPTVLAVVFAGILAYFQFFSVPLGTRYMPLIQADIPKELSQYVTPEMLERLINLCGTASIFVFLLHGALCAFAAFKLNNWAWLAMRGIGFWVLVGVMGVAVGIFASGSIALHG